jgi:hypothetical protein
MTLLIKNHTRFDEIALADMYCPGKHTYSRWDGTECCEFGSCRYRNRRLDTSTGSRASGLIGVGQVKPPDRSIHYTVNGSAERPGLRLTWTGLE